MTDYGIEPYFGEAAGPGSRRLYNLENVCEMALASWLLQAGLPVKAVGNVLTQLRRQGGLTRFVTSTQHSYVNLGVIRAPKGKKMSQDAVYLQNWEHLEKIFKREWHVSVLVIPIGLRFIDLWGRLEQTGD